MKKCKKCGNEFPLSSFYKDKRQKDGHFYYCKACCKEKDRDRYVKNVDALCEAAKENYYKNRSKVKNRHLEKNYGISLSSFNDMREYQRYRCKICLKPEEEAVKGLHVDHCHKTGKVRGLLCRECNFMIGLAKDSPELLKSAIDYLITDK
jgi:hypothetical protein